jgi:hypothetical protein
MSNQQATRRNRSIMGMFMNKSKVQELQKILTNLGESPRNTNSYGALRRMAHNKLLGSNGTGISFFSSYNTLMRRLLSLKNHEKQRKTQRNAMMGKLRRFNNKNTGPNAYQPIRPLTQREQTILNMLNTIKNTRNLNRLELRENLRKNIFSKLFYNQKFQSSQIEIGDPRQAVNKRRAAILLAKKYPTN